MYNKSFPRKFSPLRFKIPGERYDLHTVEMLSVLSELVIGGKESNFMKSRIQYTDEPMGDLKVVRDFLPSPDELVFEEDTVKVTIGLSRSSVEFFKREARRNKTAYQKMIGRLLDVYVSRYEKEAPTSGGAGQR